MTFFFCFNRYVNRLVGSVSIEYLRHESRFKSIISVPFSFALMIQTFS